MSTFFGQSSLSNYIVADEHNVVKVDPNIELKYLAPLGCGFLTGSGTIINGVKPEFGSSIIIAGAGGVGLAAVMAANLYNPEHLIVLDRNDSKLKIAKELGATDVINTSNTDDIVSTIREIVPKGPERSIGFSYNSWKALYYWHCWSIKSIWNGYYGRFKASNWIDRRRRNSTIIH